VSFGVYCHIPFCLQRCTYCDFATYEVGDPRIGTQQDYLELLLTEIQNRGPKIGPHPLDTLYFGGGTPSLVDPEFLGQVISTLHQAGFPLLPRAEVTIEINPATLTPAKLAHYQQIGINRFSLGVQTFKDSSLLQAKRKHTAKETLETLQLLRGAAVNYSADLLFALPHQSLEDLHGDLKTFLEFRPHHISPYVLTVPDKNPMAANRPMDEMQIQMFKAIHGELTRAGYIQYEISNYTLDGYFSRHNMLYWEDQEYWGIGLSAHSYLKNSEHGTRSWNPAQYAQYKNQIQHGSAEDYLVKNQHEALELWESLTDYCHTSLRLQQGLQKSRFLNKFSEPLWDSVSTRIKTLPPHWLQVLDNSYQLSLEGQLVSNRVFEKLTYLASDF